MNSYGDSSSARARAQVPGPSGIPDDDDVPAGRASYLHPASGRSTGSAPVGSASVGSASVGSASVGSASVGGRAVVGSATPGRASVGAASAGRASVGSASVSPAAVGSARPGTGGRAAVARAAVRPTSGGPGHAVMEELGAPSAGGPGGGKSEAAIKRAKRRRRANILTAAAAVLVILLGTSVVGFTYFFDSVDGGDAKREQQVSLVVNASGQTIMRLNTVNRTVVPEDKINKYVKTAVMAAEDKNFLEHGGIDMKGIARAAWNNFTGGSTQGASTITQQYARHAADLKAISYNRKLREAVIARKMESKYSKQQILGFYLNAVYFGRGANGIEAAAQAYFGKSVVTEPGKKNAITPSEAAVLASVIKQPEPVKGGHPGYDPTTGEEAKAAAVDRWTYTINNMAEKGWLTPQEKAEAKFPTTVKKRTSTCTGCEDAPINKIKKYILAELADMNISQKDVADGGIRVTTTINPKVQKAAEDVADRNNPDSFMSKLKKTYQTSIVGIDPRSGAVLAYYGGDTTNEWDYAGLNSDGSGGRPPGSTFKVYTLLDALEENVSLASTFDATKKKADGREIKNSGRGIDDIRGYCDPERCPLTKATQQSFNFPFYWIADKLGTTSVLEAAHKAGVNHIQITKDGKPVVVDLEKTSISTLKKYFGPEIGFGQYEIPAIDHAAGMATIANDGRYNKPHFVAKVERRDPQTGQYKLYSSNKRESEQRFDKDKIADLQNVLKGIAPKSSRGLAGGRPSIAKTGTWEYTGVRSKDDSDNGDSWMIGATRQIATAVWIGNYTVDPKTKQLVSLPIELPGPKGSRANMNGAKGAGTIWKAFLDAASEAIDAPMEDFLPDVDTGTTDNDVANGLTPPAPPPCDNLFGIGCPDNGGQNGNPGNGNGNSGNGNNGDPGDNGGLPTFPAGGNGNGNGNGQGNGNGNGEGNGNGNGGGEDGDGRPQEETTLPGTG